MSIVNQSLNQEALSASGVDNMPRVYKFSSLLNKILTQSQTPRLPLVTRMILILLTRKKLEMHPFMNFTK